MARPIKVRMESDGAREVTSEVRGLDRALDRLRNRRLDVDTSRGVGSLRGMSRSANDVDRALQRISRGADRAFRTMGYAAAGAGAAVGAGLVSSVKAAQGLEQELANVAAVSGATRKELGLLGDQALKLGSQTKFTATEAAQAQRELAKAGVELTDILGGGLQGALALAAAGDLELADSATFAANAMNLFGLAGKDVTKVADAFAVAANVTTADVADFGMALSQGGSAAKLAGLDFIETVTILEALAKAGVKNSDAGTSMKTALLQLVNPTAKQKAMMSSLREATGDATLSFIDQEGKLKNAVGISEVLRKATDGMTQAERAKTLAVLAGTDGIRTLNAIYEAGPELLTEYASGLSESGYAADVAAKKQESLQGRVEKLNSAIENIKIRVGRAAIPSLTRLADAALQDLVPKLDTAAQEIERIWNRDGLTPEEKFSRSWDAIAATGVPEQAKQAIYEGLRQVGINGPKFILQGLREAPWEAKGVIAALLVAKLAPAMRALGPLVGKALGSAGVGGAAGRMAPMPVYVVNGPGLVGPAGGSLPGGTGRAPAGGRLGGLARLAPSTGLRALGLGGAAIGAGMALNSLDNRLHFMSPDPAETRRQVAKTQDAMVRAWREGGPKLQSAIRTALGPAALSMTDEQVRQVGESADKAMESYRRAVTSGGPKVKRSAAQITTAALQGLQGLGPQSARLAADSMVRMTRALENEGRAPKGATAELVRVLTAEMGKLPAATQEAARKSMASFGELQGTIRTVTGELRTMLSTIDTSTTAGQARASNAARLARVEASTGAILPGVYRGRDTIPAMLAPGERVLTPRQVAMADSGVPVDAAIIATGGRVGGASFSRGGIAGAAERARSNVGEPYGKPSRGESRTGPSSWDCSGYATYVAGVNVGGTTASAYSNSSPAKGGEPIVWGFRKSHSGGYRGGYDEHMGVRVDGVWYQTSGGRTAQTGSDGDWTEIRVPTGLGGLQAGDGNEYEGSSSRPERTPRQLTVAALRAAGVSGKRAAGMASRILQAGADYAGSVLGTVGRDSSGAALEGIGVARKLRKAGVSAEVIAEEQEAAANAGEVRRLKRDQETMSAAVKKLRARSRRLEADEKALLKGKRPKAARRRALRQIKTARAKLDEQLRALYDVLAQNHVRLYELGETSRSTLASYAPEADAAPVSAAVAAVEGIGDIVSSAGRDDVLQDRLAQRDGEAAARAEGITDSGIISNRGQLAVAERRKAEVTSLAAQVKAAYDQVVARRGQLLKAWNDLYALLRKTPLSKPRLRAMVKDDISKVREELEMMDGAEEALLEQHQDLVQQAALLDLDIADLQVALTAPPSVDSSPEAEKARAAAAIATRSAGLSEAFIRGALGPGDIGSGGRTALEAAGGVVYAPTNVYTLHPGDPRTLQAIQDANAAAFTSAAPRLSPTVRTGL